MASAVGNKCRKKERGKKMAGDQAAFLEILGIEKCHDKKIK